MAVTFVQGNAATGGNSNALSQACAYPSAVTAGNLLVVSFAVYANPPNLSTLTLTDTQGLVWNVVPNWRADPIGPNAYVTAIYYAIAASSGPESVTLTAASSSGGISGGGFFRVCVHEYSGADTLDVYNSATGTGVTLNSGSATTNFANELIFGWGVSDQGVTSAGTGFTLRETAGSESTEDQVSGAAGSSVSVSFPTSSSTWSCLMATFYTNQGTTTHSDSTSGNILISGSLNAAKLGIDAPRGSLMMGGLIQAEHYLSTGTSSPPSYTFVRYFLGDPDVPRDVQNLRRSNHETMRWMGTPVLLKHMYDIEDVENGIAMLSPTMDTIYQQSTYENDQLSHGVGYVSAVTQNGEWYDPMTGNVYISATNPDPSYLPAPRYRGYGQGYLTYAIMPDRPEDVLHFTEQGTLVRSQTALVQLPWWPEMGDNDILIEVELNPNGTIKRTYERYQLKQVTPITLRGDDRLGRREFPSTAGGNRFWIGQQAELVRVPPGPNEPIYKVETDR